MTYLQSPCLHQSLARHVCSNYISYFRRHPIHTMTRIWHPIGLQFRLFAVSATQQRCHKTPQTLQILLDSHLQTIPYRPACQEKKKNCIAISQAQNVSTGALIALNNLLPDCSNLDGMVFSAAIFLIITILKSIKSLQNDG